ncbi:MAG: TM2 domain-containing protein [Eubacteriales bacterium]|nr:TM2 domain-containing protein [Eubacteriales bacterium]
MKTADQGLRKEPLWIRVGDFIVNHMRESRKMSRKKYIILALTCGWFCGAHRWYAGEKGWAVIYLCTCWLGVAAAMTIVDLLLLFLKYDVDENGMVEI